MEKTVAIGQQFAQNVGRRVTRTLVVKILPTVPTAPVNTQPSLGIAQFGLNNETSPKPSSRRMCHFSKPVSWLNNEQRPYLLLQVQLGQLALEYHTPKQLLTPAMLQHKPN
jgi:hypothetical protein